MKVSTVPIGKVKPYAGNPRRNADAVAKVAASLKEFGWRQPIVVDSKGVVVVGHTRLLAAKSLGMRQVPVHVAEGLTAAQVRAYRIADNRTGEEAEWDEELLAAELRGLEAEGYDLALTGFDRDELADLLAAEAADLDAQEPPPLPAHPKTKPGDLIRLGEHVLVCGDATHEPTISLAMCGAVADCVWTDPPYGVSLGVGDTPEVARIRRRRTDGKVVQNDDLGEDGLFVLLRNSLGATLGVCRPGAPWYVSGPGGPLSLVFGTVLKELGVWHQALVWVKHIFAMGRSDYHYQHEPIWYGWAPGAAHHWHGDRTQTTLLEFDRPTASPEHPTMKPIALVAYCLSNSTKRGQHVLDPFMGSGTTLLACETLDRVAHGVELDPRYCDVIVTRWETATGLTADRGRAKRKTA
jgi:site-specific DNA-methyltransferase (adenine-specific)